MAKKARAAGQGVVVISCSDPRLNPYHILGIDPKLGATMIRNAGGRAIDSIRSLAVLQTIGNHGTIVVMHHTDCGLTHFHDKDIKKDLLQIAPKEKESIEKMKFGEITDLIGSIKEDVDFIKASPLIKKTTQVVGLLYDIMSGLLFDIDADKSELDKLLKILTEK